MSLCRHCRGDGLVFIRYTEDEGYGLAACVCDKGKWWRIKYQLRAKAASLVPNPVEYGRLEEFFTAEQLRVLVTTYEVFDPAAVSPRVPRPQLCDLPVGSPAQRVKA